MKHGVKTVLMMLRSVYKTMSCIGVIDAAPPVVMFSCIPMTPCGLYHVLH